MYRNTIRIASLFGTLALVASAVALAGPGGKNSSSSSISLVPMTAFAVTSATSDGPSYGDSVTFTVSTDATTQPFVHLTVLPERHARARELAGLVLWRTRRPAVLARPDTGLAGRRSGLHGVPRELGLVLEEPPHHRARLHELPRRRVATSLEREEAPALAGASLLRLDPSCYPASLSVNAGVVVSHLSAGLVRLASA